MRDSGKSPAETTSAKGMTQAERAAASDRAMIDAAIELILERGTARTTLAAIGERAGYSRGLATYRYGSKSGLFKEVSNTIQRRWVGYLKAAIQRHLIGDRQTFSNALPHWTESSLAAARVDCGSSTVAAGTSLDAAFASVAPCLI